MGRDLLRPKLELLERGVSVTADARLRLTDGGRLPLRFADYATTGGITLKIGPEYVNAPVDDWFCDSPAATLDFDSPSDTYFLSWNKDILEVAVLPLPGYLGQHGTDGVMTHADRARLSLVQGCSCACAFCDSPQARYELRTARDLNAALRVALSDGQLPARHLLISGGTPASRDLAEFDARLLKIVAESPVETDVMLMPRSSTKILDQLVDAGAHGFAVNIELFGPGMSAKLTPQKARHGHAGYAATWQRAVELLGPGRVRSLLLVGLEPQKDTLAGVEFVASHGVDPVLSPFRPAPGTSLARHRPPSAGEMQRLHELASEIAMRYGVRLGPRCVPCQHNVIAVADDVAA